jgi:hypothetical protein
LALGWGGLGGWGGTKLLPPRRHRRIFPTYAPHVCSPLITLILPHTQPHPPYVYTNNTRHLPSLERQPPQLGAPVTAVVCQVSAYSVSRHACGVMQCALSPTTHARMCPWWPIARCDGMGWPLRCGDWGGGGGGVLRENMTAGVSLHAFSLLACNRAPSPTSHARMCPWWPVPRCAAGGGGRPVAVRAWGARAHMHAAHACILMHASMHACIHAPERACTLILMHLRRHGGGPPGTKHATQAP